MTLRPLSVEQSAAIAAVRQSMVERLRRLGPGKRIAYALQAAILLPLLGLFDRLPLDAASAFGGWLGRVLIVRFLDYPKLRRTVRVPFPQMSDAESNRLFVQMSENIGRTLAELVHLRDFVGTGNPRVQISGLSNIADAAAGGVGVLFVSGHFGNWEILGVALRTIGLDGIVMVDHSKNPPFTTRLAKLRFESGWSEQIGIGTGVYRTLRRRLKDGVPAVMLVDQRVTNGIKAPFFGLETTSNAIPARLARTLGAPVVAASVRRLKGANFEVRFEAPLTYVDTGNEAADERAFTGQINAFFEGEILNAPAHWLWGHPRWDDVYFGLEPKRAHKTETSG